ncbi:hypothetical protein PoB_006682200 [Plakobranchus ocellatus]|uniref:Uncharacterized protein n=1 Tax=Plakobranchus ocellatus TaxID=259542 RepID=A0AAV4D844_9GAST|nr:hypothetical protein PoB_006682200 [Plakobranchus ocellatus]
MIIIIIPVLITIIILTLNLFIITIIVHSIIMIPISINSITPSEGWERRDCYIYTEAVEAKSGCPFSSLSIPPTQSLKCLAQ